MKRAFVPLPKYISSFLVLPLAFLFWNAGSVAGQTDRDWINSVGGDFDQGANWDPIGEPQPGDSVLFDLGSAGYTVDFTQDQTNFQAIIRTDVVIWDLDGNQYTLTDTNDDEGTPGALTLGLESGDEAHLTVTGGTLEVGSLVAGNASGAEGTLRITGSDTVFRQTEAGINAARFGGNGPGHLVIDGGATAEFASLTINRRGGTAGSSLEVTGPGTTLSVTESIVTAFRDTGSVTISDGAFVEADGFNFGNRRVEQNLMTVTDSIMEISSGFNVGFDQGDALAIFENSTITSGNLQVGRGISDSDDTEGVVILRGGTTWTASGNGSMIGRQGFTGVTTEATLIVEEGSVFDGDERFRVGNTLATGLMIIRDSGSNAFASIDVRVGDNAGHGTLIIENQATPNLGPWLRIAVGDENSFGLVRVTGANTSLSTDQISLSDGNSGTGILEVEEGGALLVTGDFSIASNGTLRTREGQIIMGDAFTASANLSFDSGSIWEMTLFSSQANGLPVLEMNGDASLGDATFDLLLSTGFVAELGDVFTLMEYTGDLNGQFDGLNEGDWITAGIYQFELGYGGGFDDAITLTTVVIPEPGGLVLGLLGVALCLRRRRT